MPKRARNQDEAGHITAGVVPKYSSVESLAVHAARQLHRAITRAPLLYARSYGHRHLPWSYGDMSHLANAAPCKTPAGMCLANSTHIHLPRSIPAAPPHAGGLCRPSWKWPGTVTADVLVRASCSYCVLSDVCLAQLAFSLLLRLGCPEPVSFPRVLSVGLQE